MKKYLLVLSLLPMAALLIAFNPSSTRVQFAQTDWDSAKRKAINEGKLFFVDFDASYCAVCRNMDQSTYMDPKLSDYIAQNVVAHRVDVQDFDGVMWSQAYEVEALPTMLVFDAQGKLVQRLVGYKSANDLLKLLDEVKAKNTPAPVQNTTTMQSETPMLTTTVTQPNTTTTTTTNTTVKEEEKPAPILSTTTTNTTNTTNAAGGFGLFEISARRQESAGFGVQVGVFNSYENVLDRAAELKAMYPQQRTILHADALDGKMVYKLILGTFASRREATFFVAGLKQKQIEGVIKDLALLK